MSNQTPTSGPATGSVEAPDDEWGELGRRIHFLSRVELFSDCPPGALEHVAAALKPETVQEGFTICREGDPGEALYLIQEGTVAITTKVGDDLIELARLGPGRFFGEQAVLTRSACTATVQAVTPLSLWSLSAANLDEEVAHVPELAEHLKKDAAAVQRAEARTVFEVEHRNIAALTERSSTIRIGRAQDNDVVFESRHVSLNHAVLERQGEKYVLRDLNSKNGTSVNGTRITEAELNDGDEIRVADERFLFERRSIRRLREPRGVSIDVTDLCRVVKDGKTLLNNITLSVLAGEFVAVLGGSGAGKTMLMDAMSGVHPATSGTVRYNGREYYANIDLYRNVLGYVPQDDIIHTYLPVRRTFYHGARLRLPPDTSTEALDRLIEETLVEMTLQERAGVLVNQLSGGQRKRASIGVELLTRPRVFFLDEPTSGLDPPTETQMMQLMRKLADDGSTVLTTTHATKNVMMCDKVIMLGRGGHLAFVGSPRRALQYFQADDFDQIYKLLESGGSQAEWADRLRASRDYEVMLSQQTKAATDGIPKTEARHQRLHGLRRTHPTHQLHQFYVLTYRGLETLLRYPANLFALFGQPLAIAVVLVALFKSGVFTPGALNPLPAVQMAIVIAFAMFFFGITFGLNAICGEFSIFFRERMVNLGIAPYVFSKVAVLTPFLVIANAIMLSILWAADRLPSKGAGTYGALFLILLLTELGGLAIGLLTSAITPNPDIASRVLAIIMLPQILFSGGFVPRSYMTAVGDWLSAATVMRWAFEGTGHVLNVAGLSNVPPAQNPVLVQYGDAFARDIWQNWAFLSGYIVVPLILACLVLKRRTERRSGH